ncbi:hypothetical protein QTP88_014388 [Uroleucon formosanum]
MPYNRFGSWVPEGKIPFDYGPMNKRNLSVSSISPGPIDKKSKTFVSPNRYAVLRSDDDSGESVFLPLSQITEAREDQPGKPTHSENHCNSNQRGTYATVTANQPPCDASDNLSKLISEISNIVHPLIKLLTTILDKLNSTLYTP